jgi:hypothetical protein
MLLKFGSKSALEEDEEPEPKVRTTTVSNSTEELGLTEDGIKAFENIDCTEQRGEIDRELGRRLLAVRRF